MRGLSSREIGCTMADLCVPIVITPLKFNVYLSPRFPRAAPEHSPSPSSPGQLLTLASPPSLGSPPVPPAKKQKYASKLQASFKETPKKQQKPNKKSKEAPTLPWDTSYEECREFTLAAIKEHFGLCEANKNFKSLDAIFFLLECVKQIRRSSFCLQTTTARLPYHLRRGNQGHRPTFHSSEPKRNSQ